jgi:dUTP pyrophosphatase
VLPGGVLDRAALLACLQASPPLLEEMPDPETQVQPNGIDLTLRSLARITGPGAIGVANRDRALPELAPLAPDADGWFFLPPGPYIGTLNEVVNIPLHLMALARPRSSLLRAGVAVHTAVWDAGYSGRSQVMIAVINPDGFRVQQNARIVQLVVFPLAAAVGEGYRGVYQGENLSGRPSGHTP